MHSQVHRDIAVRDIDNVLFLCGFQWHGFDLFVQFQLQHVFGVYFNLGDRVFHFGFKAVRPDHGLVFY